jgi:hypothetical protein
MNAPRASAVASIVAAAIAIVTLLLSAAIWYGRRRATTTERLSGPQGPQRQSRSAPPEHVVVQNMTFDGSGGYATLPRGVLLTSAYAYSIAFDLTATVVVGTRWIIMTFGDTATTNAGSITFRLEGDGRLTATVARPHAPTGVAAEITLSSRASVGDGLTRTILFQRRDERVWTLSIDDLLHQMHMDAHRTDVMPPSNLRVGGKGFVGRVGGIKFNNFELRSFVLIGNVKYLPAKPADAAPLRRGMLAFDETSFATLDRRLPTAKASDATWKGYWFEMAFNARVTSAGGTLLIYGEPGSRSTPHASYVVISIARADGRLHVDVRHPGEGAGIRDHHATQPRSASPPRPEGRSASPPRPEGRSGPTTIVDVHQSPLMSRMAVNDGEWRRIALIRDAHIWQLEINGSVVAQWDAREQPYHRGEHLHIPASRLYIGGIEFRNDVDHIDRNFDGIAGAISNVTFDGELMTDFTTTTRLTRADRLRR